MPIGSAQLKAAFDQHIKIAVSPSDAEAVRGRIVLLSVHLEKLLALILLAFSKNNSAMEELLTRSLNNFNSRIELCAALGLITSRERDDLHLFRRVRNEFAHSLEVGDDMGEKLKSWVNPLKQFEVSQNDIDAQPAMSAVKKAFENAGLAEKVGFHIAALSWKLTTRIDRVQDVGKSIRGLPDQ